MLLSASLPIFVSAALPTLGGLSLWAGDTAGLVMFCWVDAYYAFEFVCAARGMGFAASTRHIEDRWAYYFGFGASAVSQLSPSEF